MLSRNCDGDHNGDVRQYVCGGQELATKPIPQLPVLELRSGTRLSFLLCVCNDWPGTYVHYVCQQVIIKFDEKLIILVKINSIDKNMPAIEYVFW